MPDDVGPRKFEASEQGRSRLAGDVCKDPLQKLFLQFSSFLCSNAAKGQRWSLFLWAGERSHWGGATQPWPSEQAHRSGASGTLAVADFIAMFQKGFHSGMWEFPTIRGPKIDSDML